MSQNEKDKEPWKLEGLEDNTADSDSFITIDKLLKLKYFENLETKLSVVNDITNDIAKQKISIDELNKKTEEVNKKADNIDKKVGDAQSQYIEILGIFVSLFTFISISTTTLLNFQNIYSALFFLSVFLFCLVSFLVVFHFILREQLGWAWLFVVGIPLIVAVYFGYVFRCHENNIKDNVETIATEKKTEDKRNTYQTSSNVIITTNISTNTVTISTQTKSFH